MSIRNAAGAVQSKTSVMANMTENTPDEFITYVYSPAAALLYKGVTYDGETAFEGHRSKAFVPGQTYRKADIDAHFPTPTFVEAYETSLGPGGGIGALAAAGGDAVTIIGTNLDGVTGVTFGGTAATSVVVVNSTKVTCVSPAKAAGAHALVIIDDVTAALAGGNATYA